jgi:hypothetical protein
MKTVCRGVIVVLGICSCVLGQAPTTQKSDHFTIGLGQAGITSLKRTNDVFDTDYIQFGRTLGPLVVSYRTGDDGWRTVRADALGATIGEDLELASGFTLDGVVMRWQISLKNVGDRPIEIGDLGFAMPFNTRICSRDKSVSYTQRQIPHFWIAGHASFIFLMRPNSVGPYLVMLPAGNTKLEYFDREPGGRGAVTRPATAGAGGHGGNVMYIHSKAVAERSKERGGNWRQPNTSLTLAPGQTVEYGFTFHWADGYDGVREVLYEQGKLDIHVIPGMTVPSDLTATFSIRTRNTIDSIAPEFPNQTKLEPVPVRRGPPGRHIYHVTFSKLGENRLTIDFGGGKSTVLEFFVTEPLETLIKKRSNFLVTRHQHRDPNKWYNGMFSEWDQINKVLRSPEDTDGLNPYVVACDDPGLCKAPYVASKNVAFPDPNEIEAVDYYIKHYVWGGLQMTEEEPYPYAIYGIPNYKVNRESNDPGRNGRNHIWRIYDYPHIVLLYFRMYQIARLYPHIKMELTADEYLHRAFGTAMAFFTVPMTVERWSAYGTGTYNELVIPEVIDALDAHGRKKEAADLRAHWERKVDRFVNRDPYLFGSEYAFDSTGFESTHALAKWALQRMGGEGSNVTRENALKFLDKQLAANLACRGVIEPAYYLLGSDYRGGYGFSYTLSYMSQMGGWSILDHALHFADDPARLLRLGYASYLSSWALMNTGTAETNYGYWYPGPENDGAAGGGFEPRAWATSWLRKSHPRGSWSYSCEIDLGFSGALRSAATIVADDALFGTTAYGGALAITPQGLEVIPRDGLRQRLHVVRATGRLHLLMSRDGFAAGQPVCIDNDGREIRFALENRSSGQPHTTSLELRGARGQVTIEGVPARVTPGPDSTRVDLQIGAEAQYPVRIVIK